jgi:gliding motility-associated protein GldM
MSIPKDPRQLMINLMYIVLTALLALNVSAEIVQAFFSIDKSLGESSQLVLNSNEQMLVAIREEAEAYAQFKPYQQKAEQVHQITRALQLKLQTLRNRIIEEAGGVDDNGQPVRKLDKDIPTRLLVREGLGDTLAADVVATREQMLGLLEEAEARRMLSASIPLIIPEVPVDSDKPNWSAYTFQQMPVAAVLPIIRKFENDVEVAEAAILNHFLGKMGAKVVMDAYEPVISAEKSYIIRGEAFTSEIFLAAYSSTADNIRVKVDGRDLPVENGKAVFRATANSLGDRRHKAIIELEDPLTGEVERYEKSFAYQVGERSVAVAADKMNVLYIGVENPLTISAAGVPTAELRVQASGINLEHRGGSKYTAIPRTPGKATITVAGGGLAPTSFEYRIKRIPDPGLELGGKRSGRMPAGTFRAQLGIIPVLENFEFDARCNIASCEVVRVPKGGDVQIAESTGNRFSDQAKRLINQARAGDTYYFNEIRVKCPGDERTRELNGLIFNIQ